MAVESIPRFTGHAAKLWATIPAQEKKLSQQSRPVCQVLRERQAGLLAHLPAEDGAPAQHETAKTNCLT